MLDAARRRLSDKITFKRNNPEIAGKIESTHNRQASAPLN